MTKKLIVYKLGSLDHWGGWMTEGEALSAARSYDFTIEMALYEEQMRLTKDGARRLGWNGDDGRIYIAGLPEPAFTSFMIAIKDGKAATTFLSTSRPLFHLDDQRCPRVLHTKHGQWLG